jgi:hypothetical protein
VSSLVVPAQATIAVRWDVSRGSSACHGRCGRLMISALRRQSLIVLSPRLFDIILSHARHLSPTHQTCVVTLVVVSTLQTITEVVLYSQSSHSWITIFAMFENYTVTASRHPSSLPHTCDGLFGPDWTVPRISPMCDSQTSITQLSQQFSEMRYTSQPFFYHQHRPTNAERELDATLSSPDYVGSLSQSRRRTQRQHGVRMLCDPSHLRNIQDMVDKMVQSGDQCAISPSRVSSVEASPSPADDEGYSSLDESRRSGSVSSVSSAGSGTSSLSFRRSVDSITGACVSKNVRVKKARNVRGSSKQI